MWTPLHSPAAVSPYAQRVMLTSTIPKLGALPQNEMPLNSSPYTIYNTDYLFCHIPWWQELSAGSSSLVLSFPFLAGVSDSWSAGTPAPAVIPLPKHNHTSSSSLSHRAPERSCSPAWEVESKQHDICRAAPACVIYRLAASVKGDQRNSFHA